MDGSDVGRVYYEDKDFQRLVKYCEQDVIATVQVLLRFSGMKIISPAMISNA